MAHSPLESYSLVSSALQSLSLPSSLTADNAMGVLKHIEQCLNYGLNHGDDAPQHIDVSVVEYSDSAGIAVLIEAKVHALQHKKTLDYRNPSQQVRDLATFLKVDKLLFSAG